RASASAGSSTAPARVAPSSAISRRCGGGQSVSAGSGPRGGIRSTGTGARRMTSSATPRRKKRLTTPCRCVAMTIRSACRVSASRHIQQAQQQRHLQDREETTFNDLVNRNEGEEPACLGFFPVRETILLETGTPDRRAVVPATRRARGCSSWRRLVGDRFGSG